MRSTMETRTEAIGFENAPKTTPNVLLVPPGRPRASDERFCRFVPTHCPHCRRLSLFFKHSLRRHYRQHVAFVFIVRYDVMKPTGRDSRCLQVAASLCIYKEIQALLENMLLSEAIRLRVRLLKGLVA